jgi:nitrile hydratase subunit beta
MNGVHDMGGMHGLGPIDRAENEPVFHAAWERRAFALTLAAGFLGKWNLDMSRYAREQMPPAEYLGTSYYEHWLFGLEKLLTDQGLLTKAEIDGRLRDPWDPQHDREGRRAADSEDRPAPNHRDPTQAERGSHEASARAPATGGARVLKAADVQSALRNRRAARMDDTVPPRFKPGDRVIARNINPIGHTRLPRYARGRQGVIDRDHGVFVFADAHAMGLGKQPRHVYSVRFTARELWGEAASPLDSVSIDLWDDHLDPA